MASKDGAVKGDQDIFSVYWGVVHFWGLSQFLSPNLIVRMPLLTFAVLDLNEKFKRATFRKIIWLLSALKKKNIAGFSKS